MNRTKGIILAAVVLCAMIGLTLGLVFGLSGSSNKDRTTVPPQSNPDPAPQTKDSDNDDDDNTNAPHQASASDSDQNLVNETCIPRPAELQRIVDAREKPLIVYFTPYRGKSMGLSRNCVHETF